MILTPWLESEIQTLHTVLLAKPHQGLKHLSQKNYQEHLFNDVPIYDVLFEEYGIFIDVLKRAQVNVLFIDDLLIETLENPNARQWLAEQLLLKSIPAKVYDSTLKAMFELDSKTLSDYLVTGVCLTELDPEVEQGMLGTSFLLQPLINNHFSRDTSTWLFDGVVVASMKHSIRRREVLLLSCIYRFNKKFNHNKPCKIWFDGSQQQFCNLYIEGGDIMLLDKYTLVIGSSERTNLNAIFILAKMMLNHTSVKQVIVPELPKERRCIHLDMVMSMVDHNVFCLSKKLILSIDKTWILHRSDDGLAIETEISNNFIASIEKYLRKELVLICIDEELELAEQWTCANNLLTIKPGTVISYEQNFRTNTLLQENGIDVITIPGSQLILGHGGTHCMSCPVGRVEDGTVNSSQIDYQNKSIINQETVA